MNKKVLALAAVTLILAGCGKQSPESKLAEVGDALGEATTELSDLDARIERTEAQLEKLRADRRTQRNRVRTLEQRLDARATDVALFRAVQTALLSDQQLQNAAIAVDVEDGVVRLAGVVKTRSEAALAIAISRKTAGVDSVFSRIRVNDPNDEQDSGT